MLVGWHRFCYPTLFPSFLHIIDNEYKIILNFMMQINDLQLISNLLSTYKTSIILKPRDITSLQKLCMLLVCRSPPIHLTTSAENSGFRPQNRRVLERSSPTSLQR